MADVSNSVEVRVSKTGPHGRPVAEVIVDNNITAAQLVAVVQNVVTNDGVLAAAGLGKCPGCKSGMDVNILGQYEAVIQVAV